MKTSGFALGFQHFPRDLANVNEWKIMFDPSIIIINKVPQYALKTLSITLGFQTEGDTPGFQIFFTDLGLVCLMLNVPVNNFSVMLGLSHKHLLVINMSCTRTQHGDMSRTRTPNLWILSLRCYSPRPLDRSCKFITATGTLFCSSC